MQLSRRHGWMALALGFWGAGCGSPRGDSTPTPDAGAAFDVTATTDGGTTVDAAPATGDVPAATGDVPAAGELCAATRVRCTDQQVMQLRLFDTPNPSTITAEGNEGGVFRSLIDARAGGAMATQGYVYARFAPTGLEKVELSDEAAFTSMDWDIAIRRYVVRINSGVGGPSCVTAARTAPGTDFGTLTRAPDGVEYRTEAYFTDTCELVNDGSGIGAPGTALASFWSYRSCVEMSGNVFVLRLRDGRAVKLQVSSYYDPAAQETCNATGMVPTPNGAGNVRMRWSFLPR